MLLHTKKLQPNVLKVMEQDGKTMIHTIKPIQKSLSTQKYTLYAILMAGLMHVYQTEIQKQNVNLNKITYSK